MSTPPNPALPLAIGALLLLGGVLLLWRHGGAADPVRQRLRGLAGRPAAVVAPPDIRVTLPDGRTWPARLLRLFGYNPNIPRSHAMAPPLVLAIAILLAAAGALQVRGLLGTPLTMALGAAGAAAVAGFLFRRQDRRYRQALFRQIPDVAGQLVRAVRAGMPVDEAVRTLAADMPSPSRGEFARIAGEIGIGVSLEAALWNLYGRVRLTEYSFLAITVGLQAQTGGNLAESLGNLAEMTRRRVAAADKARALAAEARTSAAILTALPFVTGLAMLLVNRGYITTLFDTRLGNFMLLGFVMLLGAGLLSLRWLIQRSTRD